MNIHYVAFNGRLGRSQFLFEQYHSSFKKSILDVGCYEAPIRKMVADGVLYTGVDIVGEPDVELNLEECERLPFEDQSYRTVICIEVLEHLDHLHRVLDELFRIAEAEVIVSLPNCWGSARTPITRGSGTIAHYGLPLDRPVDRHKWFLSVSDIVDFFTQYAEKNPRVASIDIIGTEKPRPIITKLCRKLTHTDVQYNNKFVHTVFGHFKLKGTSENLHPSQR